MSHLFPKVKERDDYQISRSLDEVKSWLHWDRGQLNHWVELWAMKCPSDLARSLVSMAINLPVSQGSFFSLHALTMSVVQWCIWGLWFLVWAFNQSVGSQNAPLVPPKAWLLWRGERGFWCWEHCTAAVNLGRDGGVSAAERVWGLSTYCYFSQSFFSGWFTYNFWLNVFLETKPV